MWDLEGDELAGPVVERRQTVGVGCGEDEGDCVGRFLDDVLDLQTKGSCTGGRVAD